MKKCGLIHLILMWLKLEINKILESSMQVIFTHRLWV